MKRHFYILVTALVLTLTGVACGSDSSDDDGGNNGGTNNATNNATNNDGGNNTATNNDGGNNTATNNDGGNNTATNNGGNNTATNNGGNNTATNNGGNNSGFDCSLIPTGENLGAECMEQPAEFCGDGGVCVSVSADIPFTCSQLCIPETCTDTCGQGETCVGLQGEDGQPLEANGVPVGACVVPPTGTQQAYDQCGGELGACAAGSQCLVLSQGDTTGTCLPECAGQGAACPEREGVAGQCVIGAQGSDDMFCGLLCPAEGNGTGEGCPEGMTCTVQGENTSGLCQW
jgi:hypothetical protein